MTIRRIPFRILVILALALLRAPQTATSAQQQSAVPRVVTLSGVAKNHDGQALTGIVGLTFAMYRDQQGGSPLWIEIQNVAVDDQGRYTVLLGGSAPEGLPTALFASGEPRWLGVTVQMPGEPEQPRLQLGSVPYALKALDADTLGGLPLSSFVRTPDSEKTTLNRSVFASKTGSKPVVSALTGSVTNYIPVFTDDTGTQDKSVMYQNGARVGINTTTPAFPLGVQGGIEAFSDAFPQINFRQTGAASGFAAQEYRYQIDPDSSYRIYDMTHGVTPRFTLTPGGAVGIGTTNPGFLLEVAGGIGARQIVAFSDAFPQIDFRQTGVVNGFPAQEYRYQIDPDGSYRIYDITHGVTPRFTLTSSGSILMAGNVGIGTSTPGAKLDVAGDINVSGNIAAKYQDVAEWVETHGQIESGTVVVIDPAEPNHVLPAAKAYDTRVAGAVSAKPGIVLGERSDSKSLVAQSGRVKVKADAKYGAIRIGDLLVTSPTPGHAMRSRPVVVGTATLHRPGTILGKALEALPNGKGEILVLLTLQ